MRLPVETILPLAALSLLAACGGAGTAAPSAALSPPAGPAGDYPMVLGPSFVVDGVTYTPADRMNYDAVGRAGIEESGTAAITAAHRTLPLPSYVEVTALDSGKTALVRVERRGPMQGTNLIELSAAAATQLGLRPDSPIRVRRVNPMESDRAALRSGMAAPQRIDTPISLLGVLNRKLAQQEGRETAAVPAALPLAPVPPVAVPAAAVADAKPVPQPKARTAQPQGAALGQRFIQIGAFASKANADAAARKAGGSAARLGNLWRVRTGPHIDEAAARAALAKARAAGYSDARIQHGS